MADDMKKKPTFANFFQNALDTGFTGRQSFFGNPLDDSGNVERIRYVVVEEDLRDLDKFTETISKPLISYNMKDTEEDRLRIIVMGNQIQAKRIRQWIHDLTGGKYGVE